MHRSFKDRHHLIPIVACVDYRASTPVCSPRLSASVSEYSLGSCLRLSAFLKASKDIAPPLSFHYHQLLSYSQRTIGAQYWLRQISFHTGNRFGHLRTLCAHSFRITLASSVFPRWLAQKLQRLNYKYERAIQTNTNIMGIYPYLCINYTTLLYYFGYCLNLHHYNRLPRPKQAFKANLSQTIYNVNRVRYFNPLRSIPHYSPPYGSTDRYLSSVVADSPFVSAKDHRLGWSLTPPTT